MSRDPPLVTLLVLRTSADPTPRRWWQRYEVESSPSTTVLAALASIREELDPSLAFRCSCRQGICGSCAMLVDDRPRLACTTLVDDVAGRRRVVRVAPLPGFAPERDLVVDLRPFFDAYRETRPWLERAREQPRREHRVLPREVAEARGAHDCIACGICWSSCPVTRAGSPFAGPQALLTTLRRVVDPRDADPERRLREASGDFGAFRCHDAGDCTVDCPMGLDPAGAIAELRRRALAPGSAGHERAARLADEADTPGGSGSSDA